MDDILRFAPLAIAVVSFGFACYFIGAAVESARVLRKIREMRDKP